MTRPDKLLAEWFWTDRWMGSSGFLLPMEARGLYREMLTQAWRRGGALPNDHDAIRRATGCSEDEWERCWAKVERFWKVAPGGLELVNETQLEVLAEGSKIRMARQQAGAKGNAKRWQNDRKLIASDLAKQSPPTPTPISSTSLRSVESHPSGDVVGRFGPDDLARLFLTALPGLPRVRVPLSPKLRADAAKALKGEPEQAVWEERFARAANGPHLHGHNGRGWKASFAWLINPANGAKVDSGAYDGGGAQAAPSRTETLYREAAELLERSRHVNPADETLPLGYDDAAAS